MKSMAAGVSSTVGRGRGRVSLALVAAASALAVTGCTGAPASRDRPAPLTGARESSTPTFRDCPHCPEMVMVPAGSFLIGSPESEEGRGADEGPQREITVLKPFAMGIYEVTFEEWDACVDDGGCDGYRPGDWGGDVGAAR